MQHFRILMDKFKTDYRMYYDEYFILSSEIFLFLMMIGDKFKHDIVMNFLHLSSNYFNSKEFNTLNTTLNINDKKRFFLMNL